MVARQLRQQRVFGKADSIHLASAVAISVDYFMTTDNRLPLGHTVMGVEISLPESPEGNLVLPM